MRKPRIFIASSAEALSVAEAVNVNLDHEFEVTIWKNGTFKLSSSVVPDLLLKSSEVDFSIFIFTPDDLVAMRNKTEPSVRDNVYFELGIFMGAIGADRCFIVMPRNEEFHLPSDLAGITPVDYNASRTDGDLASAMNRACTLIRNEISRLGLIDRERLSTQTRLTANPVDYPLGVLEIKFLAACLQSRTTRSEGIDFYDIAKAISNGNDLKLQICAMKLQRMGLVETSIEVPYNENYERLTYQITDMGVDVLLDKEDMLDEPIATAQPQIDDEFNEDIPF